MKNRFSLFSSSCVFLSMVLLLVSLSCSSSGGGDDGGDDGGGDVLSEYNFNMRTGMGDTDAHSALQIDASLDDEDVRATFTGPVTGVFNLDENSITHNDGCWIRVTTDGLWPGELGILNIYLNSPITSVDGDEPDQGILVVGIGNGPLYSITITAASGGVSLQYNDGTPVTYDDWDDFEDLFGSTAPEWQQQASFAYSMMEFILFHVEFFLETLTAIEENAFGTTTSGTLPAGVLPVGFTNPGKMILTDNNGGEPLPGEAFTLEFQHFWDDDDLDDIDQLYDGTVRFVNFWRITNDDILTGIGFAPYNGSGGVFFDDLANYEIEETPPGSYSLDEVFTTISGGYTILFSEP